MHLKNVLTIVKWKVMASQTKDVFKLEYEKKKVIWVAHINSETQGNKLSLDFAMLMIANYNQNMTG